MRSPFVAVVLLALTGCNEPYVQLPPFPDSGPQDATTSDVAVMEAGEGGGDGGTTDGEADAGDATSDATDGSMDAADATDAAEDVTPDAEGD